MLDDGISINQEVFASVQTLPSSRTAGVRDQGTAFQRGAGSFYPLPNGTNVLFERSDGILVGNAKVVSQTPAQMMSGVAQMTLTFDRDLLS
jgi:hypothetical protein